ncbi:MAG TPA: NAD(P)/FAD-dependent oxidoreductase [Amycolatopsis sp.]|nr:NAD(P)/FAD-dependent oxidoreductase [Amycolatopsis sp.]
MNGETTNGTGSGHYDVVVVGAGFGGIYGVRRFREQGLSVLGLEGAPDVGGVWYHNRYPGARVDVESYYYCYPDPAIYRDWTWTERYAAQPEILRYLNFVADRWDVRKHYEFGTWMTGARWDPRSARYDIVTDTGKRYTARFLVMATGQLSASRKAPFEGLADFEGEVVETSHWPDRPIELAGKRVGIIGTGSSGVQATTAISKEAGQLFVFQRTPNYAVPAHNGPADKAKLAELAAKGDAFREELFGLTMAIPLPPKAGVAQEMADSERQRALREHWAHGGYCMNLVFDDQGTNLDSNTLVADFVRAKVASVVKDPEVAKRIMPDAYPFGARRLIVETGYYESFNRGNVTLVDVKADPIERITARGVQTRGGHYDLDVLVLALGFNAFVGAIDNAGIRNEHGAGPTDGWQRGPRTFLGLMTSGFPNLFLITGAGSPSVLVNMVAANVQHLDFVADLIGFMDEKGHARVEPTKSAENDWTAHCAQVSERLIRRQVDNYMVHVNSDDGSRVFIPYAGGFDNYARLCQEVERNSYAGLDFSPPSQPSAGESAATSAAGRRI